MTKTQNNQSLTMRAVKAVAHPETSRQIENVLAIAGIAQALLYGIAEALARHGVILGSGTPDTSFPWVTLLIFFGCVLPKTVGRATAGKLLERIADRIGGKAVKGDS